MTMSYELTLPACVVCDYTRNIKYKNILAL